MAKKTSQDEGTINHYGAVRLRVFGSAKLSLELYSLSETRSFVLVPITLQSATNIEPNRLSNFIEQRASLEIGTLNIDETFQISKIIIFVKPVAKSYPETS